MVLSKCRLDSDKLQRKGSLSNSIETQTNGENKVHPGFYLAWTTHFILLFLSVSAVSLLEPSYSWKPMRLFHSFRNSFGEAQERTKEARAEENTETGMFLSPCLIAKRGLKSLRMGRISTLSLSTLRSRLPPAGLMPLVPLATLRCP